MGEEVTVLYRPVGPKKLALIHAYWILAEDLAELNRNIVGRIEVIAAFGDADAAPADENRKEQP
jgi:hypothetical protein